MKTNESPTARQVMMESQAVIDRLRQRAERAEAKLEALKKDARFIAKNWEEASTGKNNELRFEVFEVASRILEATKEGDDAVHIDTGRV